MEIKGKDIDEVLSKTCFKLKNQRIIKPRGLETKELIQQTLRILYPDKCIVTNLERHLSLQYLGAEILWYLSGDKTTEKIEKYASMWRHLKGKNGEVNSNYGEIIFFQNLENYNGSQFDWVISSLKEDKNSRQAIINFNQPKHKKKGTLDFVCTETEQFLIRNNKLLQIVNMRSNDLIYGFCYDMPFFSLVQQKVLAKLKNKIYPNLELGEYIHTCGSLHIYQRHFQLLDDIVNEYARNQLPSQTLGNIQQIKTTCKKWKNNLRNG